MTLRKLWIDFGGHASDFIVSLNEVTGHVDRLPDAAILEDGETLMLADCKDESLEEGLAFDLDQTIELVGEPTDSIRVHDVEGNPFQLKFYYSKPKIWNFPVDDGQQSASVSVS